MHTNSVDGHAYALMLRNLFGVHANATQQTEDGEVCESHCEDCCCLLARDVLFYHSDGGSRFLRSNLPDYTASHHTTQRISEQGSVV
jgi:hypothetical protein